MPASLSQILLKLSQSEFGPPPPPLLPPLPSSHRLADEVERRDPYLGKSIDGWSQKYDHHFPAIRTPSITSQPNKFLAKDDRWIDFYYWIGGEGEGGRVMGNFNDKKYSPNISWIISNLNAFSHRNPFHTVTSPSAHNIPDQ